MTTEKGLTEEEMELMERGFNQGFFAAVEIMANHAILAVNSKSGLLVPERRSLVMSIKFRAESILHQRKLVPSSYDVMMGRAEAVPIRFDVYE